MELLLSRFDFFFTTMNIIYRPANAADIPDIVFFVDFWLKGVGKRLGVEGAGDDFFVSRQRHAEYLKYKTVLLALDDNKIIGWAVKGQNDCLIHLLIAASYRKKGVGSTMLKMLDPSTVRSKTDESTGDPIQFYLKHGFTLIASKQGKHQNIDILKNQRK
jgi:GNAT superfamily N-acetyltransferase